MGVTVVWRRGANRQCKLHKSISGWFEIKRTERAWRRGRRRAWRRGRRRRRRGRMT
jgi:hypothetical protein